MDVVPQSVMEVPDVPERRKWERLPIAIPVFIRGRDCSGKEFIEFASALNISAGGMLVAVRRCIPSLAGLSVEIPSAPLPKSGVLPRAARTFKVKVLRDVISGSCHYLGLKFSHPLTAQAHRQGEPRVA